VVLVVVGRGRQRPRPPLGNAALRARPGLRHDRRRRARPARDPGRRVRPGGQPLVTSLQRVPTIVDILKVEDIGVEHLLLDIKDVDMSEIGTTLTNSVHGFAALKHELRGISAYLANVIAGRLPVDNEITSIAQSVFNLLPNLGLRDTVESLATKSDDSAFMVFVSRLCRSVVPLRELVNCRHPPLGATPAGPKKA